jgi:hypothetical protein
MNSITSKLSIIILSLMASTFAFAEDKPAEEWLFVHTAEEAQVTNNTTIVMPVTRDIFAFTDRPYRKHAYMTGEQFASLWAGSGSDSFKADPPNAVLTWIDGDKVHEAEVVITNASVLAHGRAISFEVKLGAGEAPGVKLLGVSLFVDSECTKNIDYTFTPRGCNGLHLFMPMPTHPPGMGGGIAPPGMGGGTAPPGMGGGTAPACVNYIPGGACYAGVVYCSKCTVKD